MDLDNLIERIEKIEIQGAGDIAYESVKALEEISEKKGFGEEFERAAKKLMYARPTGVSAYNCISYIMRNKSKKSIKEILNYLEKTREWISYHGRKIVKGNIMTHCHSESVINLLRNSNPLKVFVTETRPKLQGIKTAKELSKSGIPVYYIVDSAAGLFIWNCDMVLVGADSIKGSGVINKIGTFLIALTAKEAGIPFYVVASLDKIDYDGFSRIETRPEKEIIDPKKVKGSEIENPAFDLTPWKFVTGVITERGLMKKRDILEILSGKFSPIEG